MLQKFLTKIKKISNLNMYKFIVQISSNSCLDSSKKKKTSLIYSLNPKELLTLLKFQNFKLQFSSSKVEKTVE